MRRRLASPEDLARKQRRNQVVMGLILTVLMLVSIAGFGFMNSSSSGVTGATGARVTYGAYSFQQVGSYWQLEDSAQLLYFQYNPGQIARIPASVPPASTYTSAPLYIASESGAATQEIFSTLIPFSLRIQEACHEDAECISEDFPQKTCSDHVIVVRFAEEPSIFTEENCVFIEGTPDGIMNVTDEYLFRTLGIVQ